MKIELINTHRVKWLYDKCTTIDEMLERLSAEIEYLEDIRELGAKLEAKSEDDYTRIIAKVEEGSVLIVPSFCHHFVYPNESIIDKKS